MFCLELSQPWRVRELRARSDRILQVGPQEERKSGLVSSFTTRPKACIACEELYEDVYGGIRQRWLGDSGDLLTARGSTEAPIGRVTTSGKECNTPKKPNYNRNAATPPPSPWCLFSKDPSK